MFANLSAWVDHIRNVAHVPTAEYAIEAEVRTLGGPINVGNNTALFRSMSRGDNLPPGLFPKLSDVKFPTYPLGNRDEIPTLIALFYRDFWNALGNAPEDLTFIVKGL